MLLGIDGIMYAGPIADFLAASISAVFLTRELRRMKDQNQELQEAVR